MLFILVYFYYPEFITPYGILTCIITFKWPDIDHYWSTMSNKHKLMSKIIRLFCKQRGFTHSLVALAIICLPFFVLESTFKGMVMGAIIGYGGHILADMSTEQGVELLWPIPLYIRIPILSVCPYIITQMIWIFTFYYLYTKAPNLSLILNRFIK